MTDLEEPVTLGGLELWNRLCRAVHREVEVPVLSEGRIRSRADVDQILASDGSQPANLVDLGRPFYAEPRLPPASPAIRDSGRLSVV